LDFNPIEVQKHLKDINYPASKEDLASKELRNLPDQQFSGPDDVQQALKRS